MIVVINVIITMMINIIIMMTRALVLKRSESEDKFSIMQVAITISSDKSVHRHSHICSENLNNNDLTTPS